MPVYIPPSNGTSSGTGSTSGSWTKIESDLRYVKVFGDQVISGNKTFVGDISGSTLHLEDGSPSQIAIFDSGNFLVGSGIYPSELAYADDVSGSVASLQSQITINLNDRIVADQYLQQQINNIDSRSYNVVFSEEISGDGVSLHYGLTGAITNAVFISGGWSPSNVLGALGADITDLNGKPVYDASGIFSYFTRHRVGVDSISGAAIANLDYPLQAGQVAKIWYWYNVTAADKIDGYYKDDYVAKMEDDVGDLSTSVYTYTVNFDGLLTTAEDTVQKALDRIDDVAISKTEVYGISASLFSEIGLVALDVVDLRTEVENVSGYLLSQIGSGSGVTGSLSSSVDVSGSNIIDRRYDKTLTYDANGNLSAIIDSHGTRLFSYSSGNLVAISGSGIYGSKQFVYNIDGDLINIIET